jgi:hypothetical protein
MVEIRRNYQSCYARFDEALMKVEPRINQIGIMPPEENLIFLRIYMRQF